MTKIDVGVIEGNDVTYDTDTKKFEIQWNKHKLSAGSFAGIKRKINELTKTVWEKPVLFIPYGPDKYYGGPREIHKVMLKAGKLYEFTDEGKWKRLDSWHVHEFDEKAFYRLVDITLEYEALDREWDKIRASLKKPYTYNKL